MKILSCEQRSPEWLSLRRAKIGASDCAAVLGKSRYKTPRMLWKEKMEGAQTFVNAAMQKGIDLEDAARWCFEKELRLKFPSLVALHDEDEWMLASLDGWNEEHRIILEIKVVGKKTFDEVERGNIPEEYDWQVQHQMVVTGADLAYIGFYLEAAGDVKTTLVCIGRDKEMASDLRASEGHFYAFHMLGYNIPKATDKDCVERTDASWYSVSVRLRGVQERCEALEKEEKGLRKQLIELAGDESCEGYGVKATRYQKKGRVDYGKIPALEAMDLDIYRSESTTEWRISCE